MKKRISSLFSNAYIALIFLFFYIPIAVMIAYSFNESKTRGTWKGFSFKWYVELFRDQQILESLYITLAVALLAALFATVIGTAAAIGINNYGKKSKALVINISYLPVLNPDIITGISLMLLFVFIGIQKGFITLLAAHITFNIPYVIFSVLPKLRQMDKHLFEAALDLGAKPFQAFRRIVLPEILPGVITGAILSFTLSLDDFLVSYFTSGESAQTLSVTIYAMLKRKIPPTVNALSALMFVGVLVLLIIVNLRQSKDLRRQANRKRKLVR